MAKSGLSRNSLWLGLSVCWFWSISLGQLKLLFLWKRSRTKISLLNGYIEQKGFAFARLIHRRVHPFSAANLRGFPFSHNAGRKSAFSGSVCYACVFVWALRISDEPQVTQRGEGKTWSAAAVSAPSLIFFSSLPAYPSRNHSQFRAGNSASLTGVSCVLRSKPRKWALPGLPGPGLQDPWQHVWRHGLLTADSILS